MFMDPIGSAEFLAAVTYETQVIAGQPLVAIGLENEPNQAVDTCVLLTTLWQKAITAIRNTGFSGIITVPPDNFAHATTLVANGCAQDFLSLADPDKNLVLEVHEYLDPNDDGEASDGDPTGSNALQTRLGPAVQAQTNGWRILLGETGVSADPAGLQALGNGFSYVNSAGFF